MILIAGATGQLGGAVAHRLLQQGHAVRVLVRPNSPAETLAQQGLATSPQALIEAGAEPVSGDLTAPASLMRACQGVQTVITTANSAARPEETVEQVEQWGNRRLRLAGGHDRDGPHLWHRPNTSGGVPTSPVGRGGKVLASRVPPN